VSTPTLHAPLGITAIGATSPYVPETPEALLASDTDELSALRFSIILTARWAASDSESPERRAELRDDLALLRKHYGDKIDEIAMTFGIDQAMKAQEEVERTVVVPRDMVTFETPSDGGEERDEGYNL
jgi:hypothetical protein